MHLFALAGILLLAACADSGVDGPQAREGLRAVIKHAEGDLKMEVVEVEDNIVVAEFESPRFGQLQRYYYRGLIPVGGDVDGRPFHVDVDYDDLDDLFPLEVGRSIRVKALMTRPYGRSTKIEMTAEVVKDSKLDVAGAIYPVKIVSIETLYRTGDKVSFQQEKVYFSVEMGIILKNVLREEGRQTYWYVDSLTNPGVPRAPTHRAGRVMI